MSEAERAVAAAMASAGLRPHPDEIAQLVALYPAYRAAVAAFDAVEDAYETFPELIFDPRTP
jgi:hypothetical protein